MSCPRFIFLDTSVFEALGYDFEKPAARAFVEAATQTGAALVLPAGIEQEIKRHIATRASEAHEALQAAGRKAPFLSRWPKWPLRKTKFRVEPEPKMLQRCLALLGAAIKGPFQRCLAPLAGGSLHNGFGKNNPLLAPGDVRKRNASQRLVRKVKEASAE